MTRDRIALAIFVVAVMATGSVIGMNFPPDVWFAALNKPSFNPPGWLFAPVWTVLYLLIAIAGWRVFFRASDRPLGRLWIAQMILNFAWSPLFFGAHSPALALAVILLLLATIILFIVRARRLERTAAWLFVPYALWVGFATALNATFVSLN